MLSPHKILVVDDEEKIRESLSGLLEDNGYEAVTAGSGPECLQILSLQHIDLVILDIVMPEMSGIEVLEKIKKRYKDIEVIIISGYADKEKAIAAFRLNAYDLIEKPFESREILNTIANCLNQLQLRKNVEKMTKELASEKERLLVTLRSIGDGVIATDTAGKIILINKVAEELTGWTQEEAIGRPYSEVFHIINEKTREEPEDPIAKVIKTGLIVGLANHTALIARCGTERIIADSGSPIKDKDANIIGVVLVFRDITERRKADEFIKNILESVDEGFIVVDREYRIVSANKAYCDQVKRPVEYVVGRYCFEVSHHMSSPCFEAGEECSVKRTFETGEPCSSVHTHYDKNRTPIYIELKSYPMKDTLGNVISVIEIIHDVTEQKKLEAQLLHAQKMEAIGQLAGGIAHDFNNILTVILGFANLLQMEMKKDDPLQNNIVPIVKAAKKASDLTRALLAFSRKQIINPKPVNINQIITGVEELLSRIIGEDIELSIILADKDLIIMADANQIEQVLMNLFANARDAMPEGGKLTISTGFMKIDDKFIAAHAYGSDGLYALISVEDTGHGIDRGTKERIFEPFFTTKEVGKGTGLGLAMVYGIIKQHDGYINVYSEPGKGTTFKIYLPLIQSVLEDTEQEDHTLIKGGEETILVAEDDIQVRSFIKKLLEKYGYKVFVAIDGEDALKVFHEYKEEIQLIILDTIMPKKNGREVYDEIKKISPDMKTIFTSGYTANIVLKHGKLKSGINFIPKPISPHEFLTKIYEVLHNN
ncbi:MAG: response regulator [Thermodesulfovibrionales bacterium]